MLKNILLVYFTKFGRIYSLISYLISFLINFNSHFKKKKLFNKFIIKFNNNKNFTTKNIVKQLNEKGFYKTNTRKLLISDNELNKFIEYNKINANNINSSKKGFFFVKEFNEHEIFHFSTIILNKVFLKIVSLYFKTYPVIHSARHVKTNSTHIKKYYSSMNWHLDNHHNKMIKIILLTSDVNIQSGPLCFVNKNISKIIKQNLYFKAPIYFTDDEMLNCYTNFQNEINIFTGKKGDILILDTSKCFHMGSRNANEREQFFITYSEILTNDLNSLKNLKKNFTVNKEIESYL